MPAARRVEPDPDQMPLFIALARLSGRMRRAFAERMAEETWARAAGLRPPAFGTMEVVAARQPVSQREVSEALGLDPADMVAVIDLLVNAQFVHRDRDPADRRRYALVLTRQGRRALDRLEAVAAEATEAVLATLSASERAQLHRLAVKAISE